MLPPNNNTRLKTGYGTRTIRPIRYDFGSGLGLQATELHDFGFNFKAKTWHSAVVFASCDATSIITACLSLSLRLRHNDAPAAHQTHTLTLHLVILHSCAHCGEATLFAGDHWPNASA